MVTHAKSTKMHCKGDRDEGKIVALAASSLLWSALCSGPRCTGVQEPSHAVLADGGFFSSSSAAANPSPRRTSFLALGGAGLARASQRWPGGALPASRSWLIHEFVGGGRTFTPTRHLLPLGGTGLPRAR
jgi:hypothetical protein